jgi:hypothetical protein
VPRQNVKTALAFGRDYGVMVSGGGGQLIVQESYSHRLVEQR